MFSTDKMKGVVANSFKLNLAVMKLLGFYPTEKYPRFHKFYSYVVYTVAVAPALLLGLIQLLLKQHTNGMLDAFTVSFIFLSPKLFLLVCGNHIQKCVIYFDKEIFESESQYQRDIINTCAGICRRNSNGFFLGCLIAISGWCGILYFGNHSQLPLDVWLPFTGMPKLYYALYFDIVIGVFYVTFAGATLDPLVTGLICHASGQVQVLKTNLRYLHKDLIQLEDEANIKSKWIYKRISQCIYHYNAIANFVGVYERSFSGEIFCQFMESVVSICICCLQISKLQNFDINFLIMSNYLVIALVQVYFYCYYGTVLIEENDTLIEAIYMSDWYEYNQQCKNALIILMELSKRSLAVTAGKILDLSLETFTLILRRSYSLLAVLKNY